MATISLSTWFATPQHRGYLSLELEAAQPRSAYTAIHGVRQAGSYPSEVGARQGLDTIARTIRFMDAAGVRPSQAWRSIFGSGAWGMRSGVSPSGFDHTRVWLSDRRYLVTTEPYESFVQDAIDWCFAHGWQARQAPEWGMWNPPGTTLILAAPPTRGLDLERITAALAQHEPIPIAHRETAGELFITSKNR